MKKRSSATSVLCFLFFIMSLFAFLIHVSFFSRSLLSTHFLSSRNSKLIVHGKLIEAPQGDKVICDRSRWSHDICKINGPTVLDPKTSTFYVVEPATNMVETIKPYPRKWENYTMARIKELRISSGPSAPYCETHHEASALVFSAGGYTGNFFHEFSDGFIPLFITVNSIFQTNQDLVLVISKARDWWVNKYADLLQGFSKFPIINLDNETSTHCFHNATIGLVTHGFMRIDQTLMPTSTNLSHFHSFLHRVYSSNQNFRLNTSNLKRPRLVLLSRSGGVGRAILNQNKAKQLAEDVGFDVVLFKPTQQTPLKKSYELCKSSHAMIGVHGAALTHLLFLPRGAVLGQVVPLGAEWVAKTCFEVPARIMGLEYMEYKITTGESSLRGKYGENSMVVKDPSSYQGKNWSGNIMDIYLKEQNVRLDLVKFKKYLENVHYKAKKFMETKG